MRTRIVSIVLIALLALPIGQLAAPVEAKKRPRTVTRTFRNPAAIAWPAAQPAPVSAVPYPSPIVVRGLKGTICDVDLTLKGFTDDAAEAVAVLLVGPNGQTAIVMADIEASEVSDVTLRLDDEAATSLPLEPGSPLQSGAYRPTNDASGTIAFNAPAPTLTSANAALSVFDRTDPTGTWRLFVQDNFSSSEPGAFAGGWELEITAKVKGKKKRREQPAHESLRHAAKRRKRTERNA